MPAGPSNRGPGRRPPGARSVRSRLPVSAAAAIVARMARRIGTPGGTPERPALFFKDAAEFGRWLAAHHDTETELWMGFYARSHPKAGLTWEAAVREALCWGWIDSMAQGIDEHTRRQRWTPRKPTSNWSTININAVAELTAAGPHAAERPRRVRAPARGPLRHLRLREPRARAARPPTPRSSPPSPAPRPSGTVATPTYRKLATNWVVTAKQEKTRDARMAQLVDDCANGRMIPSQRYGIEPKWVQRAAAAAEAARLG